MKKINASQVTQEGQKIKWTQKLNNLNDEQLKNETRNFTQQNRFVASTKEYDGGKLKGLNKANDAIPLQGNLAQRAL